MNDRELLELAAKACGWQVIWYGTQSEIAPINAHGGASGTRWNPLTDDGDAFRLQINLKMDVTIGTSVKVVCVNDHIEGGFARVVLEIANDQYEVARRAIVMAAAEVGKEMK